MKRFYERDLIKMKPPRGYVTWTEEAIAVMLKEKGFTDVEVEMVDNLRVWIEREKESVKPPEEKPIADTKEDETPIGDSTSGSATVESAGYIGMSDLPSTGEVPFNEVPKEIKEETPEPEKTEEKKTKPAAKKKSKKKTTRKKPRKK